MPGVADRHPAIGRVENFGQLLEPLEYRRPLGPLRPFLVQRRIAMQGRYDFHRRVPPLEPRKQPVGTEQVTEVDVVSPEQVPLDPPCPAALLEIEVGADPPSDPVGALQRSPSRHCRQWIVNREITRPAEDLRSRG